MGCVLLNWVLEDPLGICAFAILRFSAVVVNSKGCGKDQGVLLFNPIS